MSDAPRVSINLCDNLEGTFCQENKNEKKPPCVEPFAAAVHGACRATYLNRSRAHTCGVAIFFIMFNNPAFPSNTNARCMDRGTYTKKKKKRTYLRKIRKIHSSFLRLYELRVTFDRRVPARTTRSTRTLPEARGRRLSVQYCCVRKKKNLKNMSDCSKSRAVYVHRRADDFRSAVIVLR